MAVSRILLPRQTVSEDSSVATEELPSPLGQTCDTSFQALLECAAKAQIDTLLAIKTNLYGVEACVFNPRFETSIYDEEDQDFHYPIIADFKGKLLITGISQLRFAGEDQWNTTEPTLWWNQPNVFDIKENAKIVVNHFDQKISLRSHNRRRQVGQFRELVQVHQLVPFN